MLDIELLISTPTFGILSGSSYKSNHIHYTHICTIKSNNQNTCKKALQRQYEIVRSSMSACDIKELIVLLGCFDLL